MSNVSQFNALETVPPSATYSALAWREKPDNSLSFRSYAQRLTGIMQEHDLRVVSPVDMLIAGARTR